MEIVISCCMYIDLNFLKYSDVALFKVLIYMNLKQKLNLCYYAKKFLFYTLKLTEESRLRTSIIRYVRI